MLDTKGPEIRTGITRDNEPVELVAGQEIDILTDYTLECDNTRITCSYKSLPTTVKPGDTILIADGNLGCEVKECYEDYVRVIVKNDFKLGSKKNMNLPGCSIDLPTLTEDDEKDIVDFGLKRGIDMIAASFI
jgi:pyruvate kinase